MFKGHLKDKSEEEQCAYLMIWVGQKGRELYQTWEVPPEEAVKLDKLCPRFENYVAPKSNKVFARYKFQCRSQQDSETAEQFITDLKVMVKDCGYDKATSDEMVRGRIVCRTKHPKVKLALLREESDLTLKKAIDVARSHEVNQKQVITMNSKEDPNVNTIRKQNPPKPQHKAESSHQAAKYKPDFKSVKPKSCLRFGYNHTTQRKCPAIGKNCKKCYHKDNIARMCLTKNRDKKIHQLQGADSSDDDYDFGALYVGTIDCSKRTKKTKSDSFVEKLSIYNTDIDFQLDTGAKCNVLSNSDFKKLKINTPLQKSDTALRSYRA